VINLPSWVQALGHPFAVLPIEHPVLLVAVAMGIFLLAPLFLQRLRIPGLIGIIVAGAIVGPNALNLLARDQTIILLGTGGLLYLMFMVGVEVDLHDLRRHRNRSLLFGALTFFIPQLLGTGMGLWLGYGLASSILLASMFASHTLVSFPIASRYGIAKNQAVTTAVGGTIITNTAALLVLAVVAASTHGPPDGLFWLRLAGQLIIYGIIVWAGLPRLGRLIFRNPKFGGTAEYSFILTVLFGGAYLAEVAGIESVVGALLVGLALNRLIPEHGLLINRIRFVGEAIFIPFFLLSIGMLVDLRIFAGDLRAWEVMVAMTLTVTATKWVAAKITEKLCGYSRAEGWTIFGLSVPQAAATLAASMIGLEVGLFDEAVLNGAIMMILVTCIVGPWVVAKYGRKLALQEEHKLYRPEQAPQRILVPMANPATAMNLMELALILRQPESVEPVYPLTVVPAEKEDSLEYVAMAEKMLSHAVAYAAGANVPVVPLTRVDLDAVNGIIRAITETRTSTVIIGWDGKGASKRRIFGGVLDQVLEQTRQMVLIAKLGHSLRTTERIILLVPEGADHVPGFLEAVQAVKLLANRLSAVIRGYTITEPTQRYQKSLTAVRPEAPVTFTSTAEWSEALQRLQEGLREDDLVIILAARKGSVAWNPALEQLPGRLAAMVPESFILLYPAEAIPAPPQFPVGRRE
jgi:Kef-type K+ transport system membrane component KefB/nucleotide-binding universal stress UspA family protein